MKMFIECFRPYRCVQATKSTQFASKMTQRMRQRYYEFYSICANEMNTDCSTVYAALYGFSSERHPNKTEPHTHSVRLYFGE